MQHPRKSRVEALKKDESAKAAGVTKPVKYHPSVFRYVCRGRLSLDSLKRPYEAGVCRGFQTQLEHVDHWRLSSEEEAIHTFQAKAALNDVGQASSAESSSGNIGDGSAHALQTIYLGNVLVYPQKDTKEEDDKDKKKSRSRSQKEDEGPSREEWTCYGTTEVDLLVLRPENSKEETIAAVAPYCAPGMTIRDVSLANDEDYDRDDIIGKDRTSTIRLGFLEILYQSSIETAPDPTSAKSSTSHNGKARTASSSNASSTDSDEIQGRQPYWKRFGQSSDMIWKQMKQNAKLIVETSQDDFWNRTKTVSDKILHEMPKTLDRTTTLMWKVFTWDWSFPPDDENGGDQGRSGW